MRARWWAAQRLGSLLVHVLCCVALADSTNSNQACAPCQHGTCDGALCRCSGIWQGKDCSDDSVVRHPLHIFFITYQLVARIPVLVWACRIVYQRHVVHTQAFNAGDGAWCCLAVVVLSTGARILVNPTLDLTRYDEELWLQQTLLWYTFMASATMCYLLILHAWRLGIVQFTKVANANVFLWANAALLATLIFSVTLVLIPTTRDTGMGLMLIWGFIAWSSVVILIALYGHSVLRVLKPVTAIDPAAAQLYHRIRGFRIAYLAAVIPFSALPSILHALEPYPTGLRFTMYQFIPDGASYYILVVAVYLTKIERDRRRRARASGYKASVSTTTKAKSGTSQSGSWCISQPKFRSVRRSASVSNTKVAETASPSEQG